MSAEIIAGDVVTLKSGGPDMTVTFIEDGGKNCHCSWFVGSEYRDVRIGVVALHRKVQGVSSEVIGIGR